MKRLILVAVAALVFAACGDRECETTDTAPVPACDWETQLWDGEQCLSRTDHEAHMGG